MSLSKHCIMPTFQNFRILHIWKRNQRYRQSTLICGRSTELQGIFDFDARKQKRSE
jgi:hypothetical protein